MYYSFIFYLIKDKKKEPEFQTNPDSFLNFIYSDE